MPIPHDVCSECETPYEMTKENSKLYCFLMYPRANHVEAICPNGHEENLFITPEGFMQVLQMQIMPIFFGIMPSEDFIRRTEESLGELETPEQSEETEEVVIEDADVPHWMLRELYDQMRYYEGHNGDEHH